MIQSNKKSKRIVNKMEQQESESTLIVSSVEKTFLIMEAFSCGKKFLSQTELTELTGMNKSAVQRFTHSLEDIGYLCKDPRTKQYCLTPKSISISYNYLRTTPLIDIVMPRLVDFRNTFDVTLNLSILDGLEVVFISQVAANRQLFGNAIIGRRVPAYCSAGGRAILSKMSKEEHTKIIESSDLQQITKYTETDSTVILEKIKIAKNNGFDINNQECLVGEIVIAAPIINIEGKPIAAIHISVSTREWDNEKLINNISNELINLAHSIHHP
jgi:DNA-binding IclR family transcriptional regulator